MAVISFSQSDKMAAITVDAGWQTAIIEEVDGPKASTSGKSVTFFTKFIVQGGKYDGKALTIAFNTGTSSPSVLGGLQFMPKALMLPLLAAVRGISLADIPVGENVDTDEFLHKPVDIKIELDNSEGGMHNIITAFLPGGRATAQRAPF